MFYNSSKTGRGGWAELWTNITPGGGGALKVHYQNITK